MNVWICCRKWFQKCFFSSIGSLTWNLMGVFQKYKNGSLMGQKNRSMLLKLSSLSSHDPISFAVFANFIFFFIMTDHHHGCRDTCFEKIKTRNKSHQFSVLGVKFFKSAKSFESIPKNSRTTPFARWWLKSTCVKIATKNTQTHWVWKRL